ADDELVHTCLAKLRLELRLAKAIRVLLRDHGLPIEGLDALVDLDALRARPHEGRLLLVPDVAHVEDGIAGRAEAREEPGSGRGRSLRALEGMGPAREVVLLDVDDDEAAGHGGSKPGPTNPARSRPIPQ